MKMNEIPRLLNQRKPIKKRWCDTTADHLDLHCSLSKPVWGHLLMWPTRINNQLNCWKKKRKKEKHQAFKGERWTWNSKSQITKMMKEREKGTPFMDHITVNYMTKKSSSVQSAPSALRCCFAFCSDIKAFFSLPNINLQFQDLK